MLRFVLAAVGAFLLTVSPALAGLETTTTLTFNAKGTMVDNFSTAFGNVTGGPSVPSFNIYGGGDIAPGATRVAAVTTPDYYLDAYFFFGVTEAGADGARHLVLGVNQDLAGHSFASLFPTYSQDALIDAIVGLNAETVPYFGAEYKLVSGFQAQYGPQFAFSLAGTGYLTAFSAAESFGTITTSSKTVYVPDAVPEPGTWLMMIVGLGAIGVLARRGGAGMRAPALS